MAARKAIDAKNLLYHFLQRDLHDEDPELFRLLTSRLVPRLAIWLAPEVYQRLPLLVPYARRDPHSRGNRASGVPDQWGSPDDRGYFRDDNSLVKGVPRSLTVQSTFPLYRSRQISGGFVAAHVWRIINAPEGAARNPLTYSFVPNLVWLPAQVAGLSDLEGSFVQRFLQRISMMLYRDVAVAAGHKNASVGSKKLSRCGPGRGTSMWSSGGGCRSQICSTSALRRALLFVWRDCLRCELSRRA